jgi:hypothetical protein
MTDDSFWREKAREVIQAGELPGRSADHVAESTVIVQRLFALAAQCVGGVSALVLQLGLTHSELRTYFAGEAMPPEEVLSRTVQLVIEYQVVNNR